MHDVRVDLADLVRSCRTRWFPADAERAPGVVVVACTADETTVDASGSAVIEHGIPMGDDTRVYAASLAKLVTGLCVHRLAAQGALDLDASVHPWFPRLAGAEGITLRHLLMHRSGLPEYHALRLVAGHEVDDRLEPADVLALVDGMTTWFAPGSRVSYNNTNFAMLAHIVAAATGEPYAEAVPRLVFEPAGMSSALVRRGADAVVAGAAGGYVRAGSGVRRSVMGAASVGDGGMWWSGRDLAALGRTLLDGTDSSVRGLREQRPLPDGTIPTLASGCVVDPAGWFGAMAEFVGFRAELRVDPARHVAIGAMANLQDAPVGPLLDALADALGLPGRRPITAPSPEPGPVPDGVLVGIGGAPWRFDATSDDAAVCQAHVGGLAFRLAPAGDAWRVVERPSVLAAWERGELVVRDGGAEIARLAAVGGTPATGTDLEGVAGWWWCPPARATLAIECADGSLHLRRGQRPAEPLLPVGDRDGRWVFAAPWGLVELDRDGDAGLVVLHRAECLPLQRLLPARRGAR